MEERRRAPVMARQAMAAGVRAREAARSKKPCTTLAPAGANAMSSALPSAAEPRTRVGPSQARCARFPRAGRAAITRALDPSPGSAARAPGRTRGLSLAVTAWVLADSTLQCEGHSDFP